MVGSKAAWTESEKLQVLFSMIPANVNWSTVHLPPGRTISGAQYMINELKKKMKNGGEGSNAQPAQPQRKKAKTKPDGAVEFEVGPKTPANTPFKREFALPRSKQSKRSWSKRSKMMAEANDNEDDGDDSGAESERVRKRGKMMVEMNDNEDDGDDSGAESERARKRIKVEAANPEEDNDEWRT